MEVEALLERARAQAGVDAPLDEHTLEGLAVFVDAANREAELTAEGEEQLAGLLVAALANRLQVENWLARHPEVTARPVERPMFVFGLPRTGTTLTINLLHQDPARRCLLRFEALASVPPPERARFREDPRFLAEQARIDAQVARDPQWAAIHHEDADSPAECQLIMLQTFCSQVLEALVHVPSYRAWYLATDYRPTFAYHKRLLQLLQWRFPGHWTLKNPWHPLFLEDLFATYPDAQLVMNHRDPVAVMGSACSLIERVRLPYSVRVDRRQIAETLFDTFARMIERTEAFLARHGEGAIYHLHYDALMADPLGQMRRLYAHFGEQLSDEAAAAMQRLLAAPPRARFGAHRYRLEDYGLTAEAVRERFRPYCERFGVACS
ncbi:MAG: sulfotransferase [Porticoccaceae bacterium]|nr:MAG: sulfotransferase [Porticoccaceae bacterium]